MENYEDLNIEELTSVIARVDIKKEPKKFKELKELHNKKFKAQYGVELV